ncbi:MAG TPA: cytochrome c [Pyrinomonadaceae bacterium]|nr:cytochrome c [Pyrinomonadaceae bacterium]
MWKSNKDTETRRHGDAEKYHRVTVSPRLRVLLLVLATCFAAGCRRDMQDQPKIKPLRGTTFFRDGLGSRQPIEGTIPRGYLRSNTEFFTGKRAGAATATATPQQQIAGTQANAPASAQTNTFPDDIDTFPLPVTSEVVERGRQRYEIFCSACHGLTGNGDGMIVRRGFRRAASFNDDRLRQAPVGHFFDAITNGWGAMPSYAAQIPVQDRWAIIAYIRALQLSQQNPSATASPSASPSPAAGGRR